MRIFGLLQLGLHEPSPAQGQRVSSDFGLLVSERGDTLAVRFDGHDEDATAPLAFSSATRTVTSFSTKIEDSLRGDPTVRAGTRVGS